MNVTFHTLTALATAAVLNSRSAAPEKRRNSGSGGLKLPAIGFTAGVILHAMLDYIPHTYPIKSGLDVMISLGLFPAAIIFANRSYRPLIGACFLGSIFPDLIDQGPVILNKHLGWSVPVVKVFPWHWPRYSGSIYVGRMTSISAICHLLVAGLSLSLLFVYGRNLFNRRADHGSVPSALN